MAVAESLYRTAKIYVQKCLSGSNKRSGRLVVKMLAYRLDSYEI